MIYFFSLGLSDSSLGFFQLFSLMGDFPAFNNLLILLIGVELPSELSSTLFVQVLEKSAHHKLTTLAAKKETIFKGQCCFKRLLLTMA